MNEPDEPQQLRVAMDAADERVVLSVRGEVDSWSAAELSAALDAAIDRRPPSVVVDLAGCEFMGSAGLETIAQGARRLGALGATLEVRSAPPAVLRLARIMGVTRLIEPDAHALRPPSRPTDPLRLHIASRAASPFDAASHALVRTLDAALSTDEVVDMVLHLVVAVARGAVGGADGASVSLRRRGVLTTIAATDRTVSDMDASQYATGQGPCVDASVEGRRFHSASLEDETRWPSFTPSARLLGISAIVSSPLFAQNRPCGALNIYSRRAGAFAPVDRALASLFARETSTVLTSVAAKGDGSSWERFTSALESREDIARAEGVLMDRRGVGKDQAFATLRRSSRRTGVTLRDAAVDVTRSTRRLPPRRGGESSTRIEGSDA